MTLEGRSAFRILAQICCQFCLLYHDVSQLLRSAQSLLGEGNVHLSAMSYNRAVIFKNLKIVTSREG